MNALRRMSELSSLSKPLKDERRGHKKSPHELARQSEAKLKQARQSEANVCRRRRRTKMKSQKLRPGSRPFFPSLKKQNRAKRRSRFGDFWLFLKVHLMYIDPISKKCIYRAFRENLVKNCAKRP